MTEKFFFSGFQFSKEFVPYIPRMEYRLFSCHDQYLSSVERTGLQYSRNGLRLKEVILDSGAFTAWTKGRRMTVGEVHVNFQFGINAFKDVCDKIWLINLDVIPGSWTKTATPEERVQACKDSDWNQTRLEAGFGKIVLPVFHQNEAWSRLDEVMAQAADGNYICASPRNDVHESERRPWAQRVHRLTKNFRTHGLATTGADMLLSVPWHSVDSASWIHMSAYGYILFSVESGSFKMVPISSKSKRLSEQDRHFDTFSSERRAYWMRIIDERGFDVKQLADSFPLRCAFNMISMKEILSQERKEVGVQTSLFD